MLVSKVKKLNKTGDIILDISAKQLKKNGFSPGDSIHLEICSSSVKNVPVYTGQYCKMDETVLLAKRERVAISVRRGDAAKRYSAKIGSEVKLEVQKKGKFWEKENAYSFKEIRSRSRYLSEESFANFRPLFKGGNMFFRSSSPFDDAYGRSKSVLACTKKYSVRTIIDTADSEEELGALLKSMDQEQKNECRRYEIFAIGDDSGLYSKEFQATVLRAISIIAENDGPFLIHCRAGKRRSGFVCAVLQGLAGMSKSAIEYDYMISYANNNGISPRKNPRRYEYLRLDTIDMILRFINDGDLSNLSLTTEKYLRSIGVSQPTIYILKEKLTKDRGLH